MSFKRCGHCGNEWATRDDFLADPAVHLDGYQANFENLQAGLFLFTHRIASCGTTMALRAEEFTDLHSGPIFAKSLRGAPECPKLCSRSRSFEPCPLECECAFVRDVLQKVLNWPGRSAPGQPGEKRRRRS